MHRYRIIERWTEENRVALRCQTGRYHVARALNGVPLAEVSLKGDRPHLGFGILLCTSSGTMFRMIFESINEESLTPGSSSMQNAAGTRQY